ncbi:MAG: CDP-diacylglycerol diphosphatase [Paraburkholderia sp.]|uniref:CDP-diacylglycerol diphosphatase n=1 Tax=Paraburkholderia sp. TaxID=1926495 RepID=UPI00121C5AD3|nr:CDP-diacylglycerol diphosphatase [Paraburkholderia sp.]TAM07039.1 MAG: CDP-diacylglycerol diphosphatase [Paraburkholderia sp.]TAM28284.1 MAG: CDP-diacylglycerol diphosphatase [Paraburkholderia sp.]
MRYTTLLKTFFLAAIATALMAASGCARLSKVDSNALWEIVGGQCVPNARDTGKPAPCTSVNLDKRYAVFKDIRGRAQYLLIPTDRVSGIESPEILYAGSPEYWVGAWNAGRHVDAKLDMQLAAYQLGLEINSPTQRSQNQLHIHVDCMRTDIAEALAPHRADAPGAWNWITLDGKRYRVTRVTSLYDRNNPFRVVARNLGAQQTMDAQTILVTGAGPDAARDGWLIVNSGRDIEGGTGNAEGLLDHACSVARAH